MCLPHKIAPLLRFPRSIYTDKNAMGGKMMRFFTRDFVTFITNFAN
jgi:hypothetical protein